MGTPRPPLSQIFGTTCPDPLQIPSKSLAQVPVRTPSEAQEAFGDAPEAPRVSPKPYARSRTTRPPTANRSASAIPLTETCAASGTRRVARLRAASCATPASLPLRAQPTADASVANAAAVCPPHRGSGGEGEESWRVFRARRGWRRAGSPRGADAEAKANDSITSRKPRRRMPEKARSELLPAPQRRTRSLSAIALSENPG